MMSFFQSAIWSLVAFVFEHLPAGPILFAAIYYLIARKADKWAWIGLCMSPLLYFSYHPDLLPSSLRWLEFPYRHDISAFINEKRSAEPTERGSMVNSAVVTVTPDLTRMMNRSYRVINVSKTDTLRVRSGPGVSFHEIGTLTSETRGIRIGGKPAANELDLWVPIISGDIHGWVHADFLSAEEDAKDDFPPIETKSFSTKRDQERAALHESNGQIARKLRDSCVRHFNTHGQWAGDYKVTHIDSYNLVFYDGKRAIIRLSYRFVMNSRQTGGAHERTFRLRKTFGDYWQVEQIGDPATLKR